MFFQQIENGLMMLAGVFVASIGFYCFLVLGWLLLEVK